MPSRLEIFMPATIIELAGLIEKPTTRMHWTISRQMHAAGLSWAARDAGELVAVAGLYPLEQGGFEAWFMASALAKAKMVPLIRAIRLTLQRGSYRGVVVLCTSEAGVRIARACGFSHEADTELGEIWSCPNCPPPRTPASRWKRNSASRSPTSPASRPKSTRPRPPAGAPAAGRAEGDC